ncbi:zinc/manganese transport system permease protein/manganese/iron transport system permease protein [Diaminobutyricimonas aerilata]|uniref:Zinc/manganese transport system permease protein/manganese/iron transport system permease protein n=1 Tax=Diaminobutyricimonas aerilata TaxID=1162967 RepID=A0A2M9CFC2_9MICO|nr:zinc ABC transporter permease AztB [Diaminobutyricimonas aerilata]PJJ70552.1 zinc/manganese transport system permease protein/manganese/iron transport system permease protein [Diaminobutyricimonas aerilata]
MVIALLESALFAPFGAAFMLRALLGGVLVAALCAVVGTWVVARGMAFLGEALAHGMLPGVALATLLGLPPVLGAAVSAAGMSAAIGALSRRRLSDDTAIGIIFAGMLALGVIIVSRSRSFATDLTAILFGDVLAVRADDLALVGSALAATLVIAIAFHRPFVALAFDPAKAATLRLRPRLARTVLVGLVTLAVVASYQAVGTLLVVALLLAPAATARHWTHRIPQQMALAAALGAVWAYAGLLVSWHAGTAAGASIALTAVTGFLASLALRPAVVALRRPREHPVPAPRPGKVIP